MKNFREIKKKINFNLKTCFLIFFILQTVLSPIFAFGADPVSSHINDLNEMQSEIADVSCRFSVKCWIVAGAANISYLILKTVNVVLWLSYEIFNLSAELSLNYAAYSKKTAVPVYEGWKITRDFMNLFFIFVILFIAISIILQLHTYGSQKILFRLIGVAIFINFSFFITQQIIIASNSMALYFAGPNKNITAFSSEMIKALNPTQTLKGYKVDLKYIQQTVAKMGETELIAACDNEDVLRRRYNIGIEGFTIEQAKARCKEEAKNNNPLAQQGVKKAVENIITDATSQEARLFPIIITALGGIAIIFTAAFIFLAAAALFLFRTAVLWILMILSPIAFMSFALPGAESYMRKWWARLFKEAFFAPAMMFMLYLVTKIITYKAPGSNQAFLAQYVIQNNTTSGMNSFVFNFYLVGFYIILLILLGMSLVIARSLGAHGASAAVKYGSNAAYWARGKAGKIATSPIRAARTGMSEGARKVAEGEGAFLHHIPGAKAAARAIVGSERQKVGEFEKQWSGRSDAEISADLKASKPMSRERLMGELSVLAKRGKLDLVEPDRLKQIHRYMSGLGMDTKEIETYMPSLSKDRQARERAVQNQKPDKIGAVLKNSGEFTPKTDPATGLRTGENDNQPLYRKYWGMDHLENADRAARTDGNAKENLKEIFNAAVIKYAQGTKIGKDVKMDDIITGLEADGNSKMANALKTEEGERIFREYAETGKDFVTGSQVTAQKAKQTLQLDDIQVANIIRAGIPAGASPENKKKAIDTMNAADNKKLVTLLEELTSIERRELRAMLKTQDPKLDQRIGIVEKERNKQILQLEDQEIADRVKKVKTSSTSEEKEDIANLINTADDKKLSAILNKIASLTERREAKDAVSMIDPKLGQRIAKLMPELEGSKSERVKIFGQMKQEDIQNFDFDGLKNRTAPAELSSILNDMIKGFNPAHLKTLAERGDNMMKEIMNKLTDGGTKTNVLDVVIKLEEPTGLNRKDLANYLMSAPAVAGLLGLET